MSLGLQRLSEPGKGDLDLRQEKVKNWREGGKEHSRG